MGGKYDILHREVRYPTRLKVGLLSNKFSYRILDFQDSTKDHHLPVIFSQTRAFSKNTDCLLLRVPGLIEPFSNAHDSQLARDTTHQQHRIET